MLIILFRKTVKIGPKHQRNGEIFDKSVKSDLSYNPQTQKNPFLAKNTKDMGKYLLNQQKATCSLIHIHKKNHETKLWFYFCILIIYFFSDRFNRLHKRMKIQ